jgi:hypothetical protein
VGALLANLEKASTEKPLPKSLVSVEVLFPGASPLPASCAEPLGVRGWRRGDPRALMDIEMGPGDVSKSCKPLYD